MNQPIYKIKTPTATNKVEPKFVKTDISNCPLKVTTSKDKQHDKQDLRKLLKSILQMNLKK